MRRLVLDPVLLLGVFGLLASVPAAGEELLTPGEAVLRELARARAAGDHETAVERLREVGDLYRYPASEAEAKRLLEAAADAARAEELRVAVAAWRALGRTRSAAAAEHVARALKTPRLIPAGTPALVAAVQAAGRIRHRSLYPPLLRLAKSGRHPTVSDQALFALGEYGRSDPSMRRKVFEEVLDLCPSLMRSRKRWRRLRAPALRALQILSGRRMNSVAMFEDWWNAAKSRPDPFG